MINPATGNRIKMKTVDAGTGEEISRGDLVKGYAIAKNEFPSSRQSARIWWHSAMLPASPGPVATSQA